MRPDNSTVIAYGNAKFPSNKKHELSAPTTQVGKACKRFFPIESSELQRCVTNVMKNFFQ